MILGGCTEMAGTTCMHPGGSLGAWFGEDFFRISRKGLCENVAIPTNSHH